MEELDIQPHLVLKKDGEDGPDVKGGQLEALIVHATKVQKVTESGKCYLCVLNVVFMLSFIAISISQLTHFLFPL